MKTWIAIFERPNTQTQIKIPVMPYDETRSEQMQEGSAIFAAMRVNDKMLRDGNGFIMRNLVIEEVE